jgi:hypothetical protein
LDSKNDEPLHEGVTSESDKLLTAHQNKDNSSSEDAGAIRSSIENEFGTENSEKTSGTNGDDGDEDEETTFTVDASAMEEMVDKALLDLYKDAAKYVPRPADSAIAGDDDNNTDAKLPPYSTPPLSVLLDMQIQSAKLENLHTIPILTREAVARHPQRQFALQKIMQNVNFNRSQGMSFQSAVMSVMDELDGLDLQLWQDDLKISTKLTRPTSQQNLRVSNVKPDMTVTLVAQVSVVCLERFRVMETKTGLVTQGDPEARPQSISHLVRFEMVQKRWFGESGGPMNEDYTENSQWKITDWDDLLEGNQWY